MPKQPGDSVLIPLVQSWTCKGLGVFALAAWLVACGNVTNDKPDAATAVDARVDAVPDGALACPIGTTVMCAGDDLVTCDGQGHISATEACSLGCNASARRCSKLDPSNGFAGSLDEAATTTDLVLSGAATIDTDLGTVVDASGARTVQSTTITTGVPVGLFVLKVKSFVTGGNVTVSGNKALVVVSAGAVTINHIVSVSARTQLNGPGAVVNDPACRGGSTLAGNVNGWAGAGGGGFGTAGGRGGTGGSPTIQGAAGGGAAGSAELVPLRGGCPGGRDVTSTADFTPGAAGGAIQIVSGIKIVLGDGGFIAANGSGGGKYKLVTDLCDASKPCGHGDGGGAGGGILLEAPTVQLGSLSGLVANGGGGGCNLNGIAESGRLSIAPALGSLCTSDVNKGGDGGAGTTAAQNGGNGMIATPVGGGGGGGAGRIRINVSTGAPFVPAGVLSGVRTTGLVRIR